MNASAGSKPPHYARIVVPPGHYVLTRHGAGENNAATGDLDLKFNGGVIGSGVGFAGSSGVSGRTDGTAVAPADSMISSTMVDTGSPELADCLTRETEMNARSSGTSIGRLNVDKRDPLSRRERIPHLPRLARSRGASGPKQITAKCEGREAGSAVLCAESR